jgi:hypothetical protein
MDVLYAGVYLLFIEHVQADQHGKTKSHGQAKNVYGREELLPGKMPYCDGEIASKHRDIL